MTLGVVLLGLGIAGITHGLLSDISGAFIVTGGLQLGADLRYIPRAIRAVRHALR
jgi:hypothetical protein